uniref:Uncharacterized protein n=1 Tax=Setaria italica TaxID=4555 RepID=K4AIB1_SETIT
MENQSEKSARGARRPLCIKTRKQTGKKEKDQEQQRSTYSVQLESSKAVLLH